MKLVSVILIANTRNCESEDRSRMRRWAQVLSGKYLNQGIRPRKSI